MRLWLILLLASARADVAVAGVPMVGPFASLDEICREVKQRSEETISDGMCIVGPRTDHAAVVRVLSDLDGGRAGGYLALRTAAGWLVDEDLPDFTHNPQEILLHDNLRYTFRIDGLDEREGVVILHAVHALYRNAEHPFTCVGLEVHCRGRICAKPIVTSRRRNCHPDRGGWPAIQAHSATAVP
jgi:hypothetical protein